MKDPVIIIGMHRSGTSTLSRRLKHLGLFQGARLDANHEPFFFRGLNDWLFRAASANWDYPSPFEALLDDSLQRHRSVVYLRDSLASARALKFLGMRRFLSFNTIFRMEENWGWKDPRNSFTLPLWLEIFPNAKVIHVLRHGIDVANSLARRCERNSELRWRRYRSHRLLHSIFAKRAGFTDSLHTGSIEGGFRLWCQYLDFISQNLAFVKSENLMTIRYEEFLESPAERLRDIASFCDLSLGDLAIDRALSGLVPGRRYAYRQNKVLREFAFSVKTDLKGRGYSP